MVRIFLPLASLSTIALIVTMVLGLLIDDPKVATAAALASVQYHFLTAIGSLCFATLVHAIVLTYFMGTGRWIEETSNAYKLPPTYLQHNQTIKYRVCPALVGAFLLLLLTGALGAASDPAAAVQFKGLAGLPPVRLHLIAAIVTVLVNIGVNVIEFLALEKNGEIVEGVLAEVRRIRTEKGLAV